MLSRLYNIQVNSKRCISPRRQPFFCFFALQIKKVCFCIEINLKSCFWPRREHLFLKHMHFVHRPPSRPLGTTTTVGPPTCSPPVHYKTSECEGGFPKYVQITIRAALWDMILLVRCSRNLNRIGELVDRTSMGLMQNLS